MPDCVSAVCLLSYGIVPFTAVSYGLTCVVYSLCSIIDANSKTEVLKAILQIAISVDRHETILPDEQGKSPKHV